jgi:gluconolactonase
MTAGAGRAPGPWHADAIEQVPLEGVALMAEGLEFPEGPVAMDDGTLLVTEIDGARITRVHPDGKLEVVARCDGGPNGAAIGPDGALYVCNNGGRYASGNYNGGWVDRVDLSTGQVDRLYTHHEGRRLSGPNDIVFDRDGGFWFSDLGKTRGREKDVGSIYYATIDGRSLTEVIFPAEMPNGIGLSPDGGTVYYAETGTARLRARRVTGPGQVGPPAGGQGAAAAGAPGLPGIDAEVVAGLPGHQGFDSLAVDSAGNVCVATLITGGVTVIAPDGSRVVRYVLGPEFFDPLTTNICFGGPDMTTAFITLGHTGRVVTGRWPVPGLRLNFNA